MSAAEQSIHRAMCVRMNHPGMTYNASLNKTWCACGEVITDGNTDSSFRCCGPEIEALDWRGLSTYQLTITAAIVATLRQMAWVERDTSYLSDSADEVEQWAKVYDYQDSLSNACCPLCQEMECDSSCPLASLRIELDMQEEANS